MVCVIPYLAGDAPNLKGEEKETHDVLQTTQIQICEEDLRPQGNFAFCFPFCFWSADADADPSEALG